MCFAFHLLYIKGEYTPYTRENIRHIYKEEKETFDAPRKKTEKHFVVSALNRIFAEI